MLLICYCLLCRLLWILRWNCLSLVSIRKKICSSIHACIAVSGCSGFEIASFSRQSFKPLFLNFLLLTNSFKIIYLLILYTTVANSTNKLPHTSLQPTQNHLYNPSNDRFQSTQYNTIKAYNKNMIPITEYYIKKSNIFL